MKNLIGVCTAALLVVFSVTRVFGDGVSIPTSSLTVVPDSEVLSPLGNASNWVDTDKSHGGTGGWGSNYYNDLNGDGDHDPGESFSDSDQGGWTKDYDNSCWLASACNMLEQIGVISSASTLYNNYALNGAYQTEKGTR